MSLRRLHVLGIAMLLAAAFREAPAQGSFHVVGHDLRDAAGDLWALWSSPARVDARDAVALGAALGAIAVTSAFDRRVDAWVTAHPSSAAIRALAPMREGATLRLEELPTGGRLPPLSGALYLAGLASGSAAMREAGLGCITAWGANTAVRYAAYEIVSRPRPSAADGDPFRIAVPGGGWKEQSFFGGHVANGMACASFWGNRFTLGAAEPALYALALAVGVGRIADRRHWTSDTMAGAVFGYAVGRAVAGRYQRRAASLAADASAARRHSARVPLILWRASF